MSQTPTQPASWQHSGHTTFLWSLVGRDHRKWYNDKITILSVYRAHWEMTVSPQWWTMASPLGPTLLVINQGTSVIMISIFLNWHSAWENSYSGAHKNNLVFPTDHGACTVSYMCPTGHWWLRRHERKWTCTAPYNTGKMELHEMSWCTHKQTERNC